MKSTSLKVVKLEKHCPRVSKTEFGNQPQIPKTPLPAQSVGPLIPQLAGPHSTHSSPRGWLALPHWELGTQSDVSSRPDQLTHGNSIMGGGGEESVFLEASAPTSATVSGFTPKRGRKKKGCAHTPLPQSSWRAPTSVANSHGSLLPACEGRAEGRRGAGRADLGAGIQGRALQAPCK